MDPGCPADMGVEGGSAGVAERGREGGEQGGGARNRVEDGCDRYVSGAVSACEI